MDLTLSDEQEMLVDAARGFVARTCDTRAVRTLEAGEPGYDPDQWTAMSALGWPGLTVPEDHGGAGRGLLDLVLVAEQCGRGPVPSPLVTTAILGALPIVWGGSAEQRSRLLPALAAGRCIATLALLEPEMGDEWGVLATAGGACVRGTKLLVPWAGAADLVLVATTEGVAIVAANNPGIGVERHEALGGDPLYAMRFDDARAQPLGEPDSRALVDRALDWATVASLAYAVGAAEQALALSVRHAKDRHQFGRPIGSFQAVAHRCADMRADVDACRVLAYQAAWALDGGGPASLEVAAAKAYANDALRRVSLNAHQVHGAIGFSTEHDLHLFTRRLKAFELTYGSTARHQERVATAMGLA